MNVSPTAIAFDAAGVALGGALVTVEGTAWSAVKAGDWFTLSVAEGEADGTFTVTATANTELTALTGSITVKSAAEEVDDVTITVTQAARELVRVATVTLDAATGHLVIRDEAKKTMTLTPEVLPANADNPAVTWNSETPAVATVVDGVVTAVSPGTTKITATADEKTAECEITVTSCGFIIAEADLPQKYNYVNAVSACPEGWMMPSADEFVCMCENSNELKGAGATSPYIMPETHYYTRDTQGNNGDGVFGMMDGCLTAAVAGMNQMAQRAIRCVQQLDSNTRCYTK
jgi:hypothetical protein